MDVVDVVMRPTRWDLARVAWPPLGSLAAQFALFSSVGVRTNAVPMLFWVLAIWTSRRQPEGRAESPAAVQAAPLAPAWLVPARHRVICGEVGALLAFATMFVGPALGSPTDVFALVVLGPALVAVAAIVLPRFVRATMLGEPVLRLTPEGIVVRGRRLRWDDLAEAELKLRVNLGPTLVIGVRTGRPAVLRERYVHANLVYLLDLIGYYLAHPERRVAIGTAEEADRITAALRDARLAAPIGTKPIPLPS